MTDDELWRDVEEGCSFDIGELMKSEKGWCEEAQENLVSGALEFAREFTGKYFREWVESVEQDIQEDKCQNEECPHRNICDRRVGGIAHDDIFITFNYTSTLQQFYGVSDDRICHVHGRFNEITKNQCGDKLMFGSPDMTKDAAVSAASQHVKSENMSPNGARKFQDAVGNLVPKFHKDVNEGLGRMEEFLHKHRDVSDVVVAGHSLGKIDRIYFDWLAKEFGGMKWWFLCHTESDMRKAADFALNHRLNGHCVAWNQLNVFDFDKARSTGFSCHW